MGGCYQAKRMICNHGIDEGAGVPAQDVTKMQWGKSVVQDITKMQWGKNVTYTRLGSGWPPPKSERGVALTQQLALLLLLLLLLLDDSTLSKSCVA